MCSVLGSFQSRHSYPLVLKTFSCMIFILVTSFFSFLFLELLLIRYGNFYIDFNFLISFLFSICFLVLLSGIFCHSYLPILILNYFLANIFISKRSFFFCVYSLTITHYSCFMIMIASLRALIIVCCFNLCSISSECLFFSISFDFYFSC